MKKTTKTLTALAALSIGASAMASPQSPAEPKVDHKGLQNAESIFEKLMVEGEKRPKKKAFKVAAKKKEGCCKSGTGDPDDNTEKEPTTKEN